MLSFFSNRETSATKYERLYTSEQVQDRGPSTFSSKCFTTCLAVLVCGLVSTVSYTAGRASAISASNNILNLTSHEHRFEYNRTFTEKPNTTTNAAWKELFPEQGGFFKHPDLAANRSTFAVFHQLHCLDGLRHGYWALLDIAASGQGMEGKELPFHASPRHIRHCIDLLRNVLVCQPDLTLEVRDDELGGVTGFGTEHQCINWQELLDWTTQWETYQQRPGAKKRPHGEEGGHQLHE